MKEFEIPLVLLALGFNYSLVDSSVVILPSIDNFFAPILNPPNFNEMATMYGYQAESHEVTTEDGYILTLFHIPGSKTSLPVLLFHGIFQSSDTWIVRGNTSLAITLAKKNYDVWFANVRGNRYARRHIHLNPDTDDAFWNYSIEEHGLYDLAANIDYILDYTSAKKLNVFGFSQGNTILWILLSTRTQYNDKINVATALAPICYLKYVLPPLSTIWQLIPPLGPLLQALGVTEVFADNSLVTIALRVISRIPVVGYILAGYGILFTAFGTDSTELEPSFLPTAFIDIPTSTSLKNLVHYGQFFISDQFTRFDYGMTGNLEAYNSSLPPAYELEKIHTKVVLLTARNDKASQLADVDRLRRELPNVIRYVVNPRVIMNHLDYVWGRTAPVYLYKYIFEVLDDNI